MKISNSTFKNLIGQQTGLVNLSGYSKLNMSGGPTTLYNIGGYNSILALNGDTLILENINMDYSSFISIQN